MKYEAGGVDALKDNRGKRKQLDEMSELERLRAENRILKAEKERAEMEISFLKKLEEIERRRGLFLIHIFPVNTVPYRNLYHESNYMSLRKAENQ